LSKKTNIELADSLGALTYFLDCLKIKTESSLRTQKKSNTFTTVKELSSSSSKQSLKDETNDSAQQKLTKVRIPLNQKNSAFSITTTSRQLNFTFTHFIFN
jgi:hypothetical protein